MLPAYALYVLFKLYLLVCVILNRQEIIRHCLKGQFMQDSGHRIKATVNYYELGMSFTLE